MKALWLLPPVRRNLKSSKPTQRTSPKGLGEVFSEFHEIALASAGDVQAFDKLYTQLTGWAQGSLGKSIAIIFLLVGLAVGLAKGSLYAGVVSIACGLTLMIAPSVIDSIFTV